MQQYTVWKQLKDAKKFKTIFSKQWRNATLFYWTWWLL